MLTRLRTYVLCRLRRTSRDLLADKGMQMKDKGGGHASTIMSDLRAGLPSHPPRCIHGRGHCAPARRRSYNGGVSAADHARTRETASRPLTACVILVRHAHSAMGCCTLCPSG